MDCVHRILQARILEWVATSFSRGSSWPRDRTQVSHIAGRRFTIWATREVYTIFRFSEFLLIPNCLFFQDPSQHTTLHLSIMSPEIPLGCDSFWAFSCFWWPWRFWGILVGYFVERPSVGICLNIFLWLDSDHEFLGWRLQRKMPFSLHHIKDTYCQHDLSTLSGLFTVKLLIPPLLLFLNCVVWEEVTTHISSQGDCHHRLRNYRCLRVSFIGFIHVAVWCRNGELCCISWRMEDLHNLFGILLLRALLVLPIYLRIYVSIGLWIGEGNGTPLQYSCLENPMDRGAWWAPVHGVAKSRTRLSDFTFTFHFSLSCFGEGNGNPLQCSCRENPRDGGAWWAAVYGVARSWTRLRRLSGSSRFMDIYF